MQEKAKYFSSAWAVAALPVPVPSRLIEQEDAREWINHVECLSPAQTLSILGKALDQFHGLIEKAGDPLALPEEDQITLYSKWRSAHIVANAAYEHLGFRQQREKENTMKSDMDKTLFCIVDLLKNVNSADTKVWEDRRTRYNSINNDSFDPFRDKLAGYAFARGLNSTPKFPGGPAA